MINNYIHNILLSPDNSKLIINFKNTVYNNEKKTLNKNNFKLHLLSHSDYQNIEINNVYKNEYYSYSLDYTIEKYTYTSKDALLFELISVYDVNMVKLNNYQENNYVYLNDLIKITLGNPIIQPSIEIPNYNKISNGIANNEQTTIFNNINNNNDNKNISNSNKLNYIQKSSPGLAYKLNLKKYHLKQIAKYPEFYGRNVRVYPNSYYETSYDKMYKPFENKNTERQKIILNPDTPQIVCLQKNSKVNIIFKNGNKYVLNNLDKYSAIIKYGLYTGTYQILDIPIGYPMAILNIGMEDSVTYTGDDSKKLVKYVDNVDRPGNYNFYYGKLVLTVHAEFNEISVYSYYFGYMGGENLLMYNDPCNYIFDIQPIPNELFFNVINKWFTNSDDEIFTNPSSTPYYGTIENWNTILILDMSNTFKNRTTFNSNISAWDTSNVSNMNSMFYNAYLFNSNISSWDTSNVSDMSYMFYNASAFNQNINTSNPWTVSNVTDMGYMFYGASSFNQSLDLWDTSNVIDMNHMFYGALLFNQTISTWITSNVLDMSYMFYDASLFNQYIGNWDTSNVLYMNNMFNNAVDFNQNIISWNVLNVSNMSNMFNGATVFNQYIRAWNTINVNNFNDMFLNADSMIATYNGVSGFGSTPTQDFFNQTDPLTDPLTDSRFFYKYS